MMSLWDALRMNMMISYQELVRTFPSMVLRLDQEGRPYNEGEQVVIGGNERYVSVCRKHYKEALSVGSLTQVQNLHRPC
ncbi:thymidine kinase [Klebsiella quasipneumoniae]|nr:thymidine kinase [Klebsiella quasipneumoniae]